jgi:thiosulfate/3-mercaptopyruvate sulfurtransferase
MLTLALILAALSGDALLIAPEDLATVAEIQLVDVRDLAAYEEGHIPGAVHLDVDTLSEERDGVRGVLKPVADVRTLLAAAGVDPQRRVVVYGAADELKQATRMFWILEYLSYPAVSLLDGGYEGWVALGTTPATGPPPPSPIAAERIPQEVRSELLATVEDVKAGDAALIDLRSREEYVGASKQDFVAKPGHIPGAVNLPGGSVVEDRRLRLKSQAVIAELLREQGVRDDQPVITYCNTGRDGTVGYFINRLVGREDVAVYDGSMAEWASREEVETDPR